MKTQNRKPKTLSGRAFLALCLALTIPLAAVLTACGDRSGTLSGESLPESGSTEGRTSGEERSSGESQPDPEEWEEPEIPQEPDVEVTCSEGTDNCWTLDGTTLTFGPVTADTICTLSGTLNGRIVIDAGDDYAFELELKGFSVSCDSDCPVTVLSGDKVTLTAKKDTENMILDKRETAEESEDDDTAHSAAVWSKVDLVIGGKGALTVKSENNNGIHGKDDLKVKNLTLNVACEDNALKGNDSVEIESGTVTLIARTGDGVKTTNTDVSAKGNQRGNVTLTACVLSIYAACDGIDAAYDVVVEEGTALTVRTDRYSDYSEDVTVVSDDVRYIRFTSKEYSYSVRYGSGDDAKWVNASCAAVVESFRETYYYYSFPIEEGYESLRIFVYSSGQKQGQADDCLVCTDDLIWNTSYDTFALSQRGSSLSYGWTNYSDASDRGRGPGGGGGWDPGGPGGGGNTDKSDHSAKGVKAGNALTVNGGTLDVKAYDDALHANADETPENGETPTGDVTIKGGALTLFSGDDAIHAEGTLTVEAGTVNVTGCYEGLEAPFVEVKGGNISVVARDDGINSTRRTGTGVAISGGTLYIYAGGDGIDANTSAQYEGIVISGGRSVVISTSNANSSLDTERGYTYTGGEVLALGVGGGMGPGGGGMGPGGGGGMAGEAVNCRNFSAVGTSANQSLSSGQYLTVTVGGSSVVTLKMPCSLSALVVFLGSSDASFAVGSASADTDANGVCWY